MTEQPSEHTFEELAEHVIKAIAEVREIPADTITLDSTFEELAVDSLDAMEMLFLVEEELDISMPDTAARAMRNVRQVVEALDKLLKGEEIDVPELPGAEGVTPEEGPQAEAG